MMNATVSGYSYDILTNTLTVTDSFLKRASKLGSREYETVKRYRAENPDIKITKIERNKTSRKSITFKQMEAYILLFDDEKKTVSSQFAKVKSMSKIQASPYNYVKKWFEAQFPNYTKQVKFDENGKISFVKEDEKKEVKVDETQEAVESTHVA